MRGVWFKVPAEGDCVIEHDKCPGCLLVTVCRGMSSGAMCAFACDFMLTWCVSGAFIPSMSTRM